IRSAPHPTDHTEPVQAALDVASEIVGALHELAVDVAALELVGQALSGQIAGQLAAAQRQLTAVGSTNTATNAGLGGVGGVGSVGGIVGAAGVSGAASGTGAGPPTVAGQFAHLITAATTQPNGTGGRRGPGEGAGPGGPGAPGEASGPGAPGEANGPGGPG